MSLPFRYVTRSIRGFIIIGAVIVGSQYLHEWIVRDYTTFRDKSALYGRDLKEGEEPSW